ncbi:sensor domain-containing diguanylate cyclase [Thermomonas sp.]|uniref:GGDEF domain-containing protein n=1 Tax=Thermomonas sp. TaxID=1971895 RepID=UPI002487001A|nr:sensor domain-containing diguanylate cyclase [Thermomonas sp.]MDI1253007.1 sensor domain-containing diguanylate cyclase [Thermomonas sp.]
MTTHQNQVFRAAHGRDVAEDAGVYKTLLESTNAIPWKLDWPDLRFAYIGPQIESLLGWTQDSWKTVEDWATRMHPDDRERTVNFCVAQSQAGMDHEADYRALTRDGAYVWIRDVVHVTRNDAGEVTSLVGFMFDISERKQAEVELLRLHKELEALSLTDALTEIANRRLFDQRLDVEWNDSRRSGKPLSLLIVDIDWFKQYNDLYGHPAGDACLKQIAGVLQGAARRSRDVAARLGGDEFGLLLPDTDAATAQALARELEAAVTALQIPHGFDDAGEWVSISIGVDTQVAGDANDASGFVDHTNRMLYAAKRKPRAA